MIDRVRPPSTTPIPSPCCDGSRGAADLLAKAKRVRARLASDPAVPRWARALLPLIAILQTLLILVIRPLYHVWRDRREGT